MINFNFLLMQGITFTTFKTSGKTPISKDIFTSSDNQSENNAFNFFLKKDWYANGDCRFFSYYFVNYFFIFIWFSRRSVEYATVRIDETFSILITFVKVKVKVSFLVGIFCCTLEPSVAWWSLKMLAVFSGSLVILWFSSSILML